eukprot:SAG31_NODE_5672_length_2391_cov_1.483857_2_plen_146_part_00
MPNPLFTIIAIFCVVDAQGFGCVVGSHRAGYELPIPREPDASAGYPALVTRVRCEAGSCTVFNETLWHCSLPWTAGSGERTTLFLKYSPKKAPFSQKRGDNNVSPYRVLLDQVMAGQIVLSARLRSVLGLSHDETASVDSYLARI